MCRKEASEHIEELLGELKSSHAFQGAEQLEQQQLVVELQSVPPGRALSTDERIRLGMAAKLVYKRWSLKGKLVLECSDEFKEEVLSLCSLLARIESELRISSAGAHG